MPEFIFTSPEGQKYRVRGPEGATQEDAFAMLQQQMKQQPSQPTAPQQGFFASEMEKAMNAPGDIGRMVLKGATLGQEAKPEDAADRANAALAIGRRFARGRNAEQPAATPQDYRPMFDAERKAVADAEARSGWAGTAAQAVGVLAPATAANKVVQGVAGAVSAVPGIGRVAANPYTQAAATGAGLGVMGAAGTDKDLTEEALLGAGLGVVGQGAANAIVGGVSRAAGIANPRVNIPTRDSIGAAKTSAYQTAEDAGVVYTPNLFKRVQAEIEPQLAKMGYDPALQPSIAPVLRRIEEAAKTNTTLPGVEVVRRVAQNAYVPGSVSGAKASNAMMTKIINTLEDAATNPRPGELLMGDAARGIPALREGRRLASTEFKMDEVARQVNKARTQAGSTWSGGNTENSTRQKLRSILDNPERSRGFTPDELAALDKAVMGSGAAHNTARLIGKLSPQGSGLMAALGIGGTVANPMLSVAPLAGIAAKKTSEKITEANVKKLLDVIAAGGKESATRAPLNKVQQLTQNQRELLARALMGALVFNGGAVPASR